MIECEICGEKLAGILEMEGHWSQHKVRPVRKNPLSYLLVLPDGTDAGRHEAAEAFVDAFGELFQKHPDKQFDFFPLSFWNFSEGSALTTILAVAK